MSAHGAPPRPSLPLSARLVAEVDDASLRLSLAGLRDRFADVVEDELVGRRIHVDQQAVALGRLMDLSVFRRLDDQFFSGLDVAVTPVPHYGQVSYPNSLELRNFIYGKVAWYGSARGEIRALIRHLDEVVALLDRSPA